jgi:3-hydroxybutyryl-CoA dehydrogenase
MMISKICVCGAGTMGSGIALSAAQSGYDTILFEPKPEILENAAQKIRQSLAGLVAKEKITAAAGMEIEKRIRFTSEIKDCRAEMVIEAIIEDTQAKISLFKQLEELNDKACILASNTSSLSVTALAEGISNAERLIGLHFFNPPAIMKLVEIVVTVHTSDSVRETTLAVARKLGKTPVLSKDSPGFIVNRVARPYYIESLRIAEEAMLTMEDIDALMESAGFRMGPFRLMDLIGNDVNYAVSCSVYDQLGRPERLRPSPIQDQKVREGKWGKKSGEGYYKY